MSEFIPRRVKIETPEDEDEGASRFVCFTIGERDEFGIGCFAIEMTQFGVIVGLADDDGGANTLYPWNRVLWVDDMEWRQFSSVPTNGDGGHP